MDTEDRPVDTLGAGEGGTSCESSSETHTATCETDSGKLPNNTGTQPAAL